LLAKLASGFKNCEWIYRFRANPGMPRGGIVPPTPVLAPGSALRSRPRVALSSAQVPPLYSSPRPSDNSRLRRSRVFRVRGAAARLGRCQLPLPLRPDRLLTTGQLVCRRDVADRAVQANGVVGPDPTVLLPGAISGPEASGEPPTARCRKSREFRDSAASPGF